MRINVYGTFYQSAENLDPLYRIVHQGRYVIGMTYIDGMEAADKGGTKWNGTSSLVIEDREGAVAARDGDWLTWQSKDAGYTYKFEAEADPDHDGYYFLKLAGKWLCIDKDNYLNVKNSGWYVLVGGPE